MNIPLHGRVCEAFVFGFGGWTLLCHAVVFSGGSLFHLLAASGVAIASLLLARRRPARRASTRDLERSYEGAPWSPRPFVLVLIAALIPVATYWRTHDPVLLWYLSLPALALGAWQLGRDREPAVDEAPSTRGTGTMWLVAAAMAVLAVTSHSPDADDAMYLSFVTQTADFPHQPLMAKDGILGLDLPLLLSIYRVQSFEVLGGALAYLTHTSGLVWMHLVFPFLGAAIAVLALAQLARLLVPRHGFWLTMVAVAYLVLCDGGSMSHGNHAFARLHQGKAWMLTAAFPLALFYALDYVRQPSVRRWMLLFFSQIAAIGLSVNAVSLLPVVIVVPLLASLDKTRRAWTTAGLGLLSLAYPLALGWTTRVHSARLMSDWTPPNTGAAALQYVAEKGIGDPALVGFVFLVLLTGWAAVAGRGARRALWLLGTVFLLVFFNPYFAPDLIALPERRGVYPRAVWIVPLPLLVGVVLSVPLRLLRGARLRWASALALAGLTFTFLSNDARLLRRKDGWLAPPRPKVPLFFAATQRLAELAGPSSNVLAPPPVSAWLPALRQHPYPVYSREIYRELLEMHLGKEETERRRTLALAVAGRSVRQLSADEFRAALEDYSIAAVCLEQVTRTKALGAQLEQTGFVFAGTREPFEFWSRPPANAAAP